MGTYLKTPRIDRLNLSSEPDRFYLNYIVTLALGDGLTLSDENGEEIIQYWHNEGEEMRGSVVCVKDGKFWLELLPLDG